MELRNTTQDLARVRVDLAACFAYEGDTEPRGVKHDGLRTDLAREMRAEKFKGRTGDLVVWNGDGRFKTRRFVVVGLGKPGGAAGERIRRGAARAARVAVRLRAPRLALRLPPCDGKARAFEARAAVEGAALGGYAFDRYLTDPEFRPERLRAVVVSTDSVTAAVRESTATGGVIGTAANLARDLVNEPPSVMDPPEMARRARKTARDNGLTCRVLTPPEIRRLGMGALLNVARGSSSGARVVHLTYRPKRRRRGAPRIVLVGKGVTFDSGGLNLKPTASMLDMKCDMAGAAAVLGAMSALRDTGCEAEVHGLIGLVENMTGASAYKPGDILRTYAGKTVEVTNTDAEGRLVLADLLSYAAKTIRPDAMVDLATLTGACVVALGTQVSGVFARDDGLRDRILEAGASAGEMMWPLPMLDEYLDTLQGGPADLRNSGDRWGGAITAALFLGEFVPRSVPWLHLDIAGPAFAEKATAEGPAGGTGAGVRTLIRWLEAP